MNQQKFPSTSSRNIKSQITIYIITGVIILFIFILLFSLNSTTTSEKIENQIEPNIPQTSNFEKDFQLCFDQKYEQIVDMVFKQGGIIYEDQGGFTPRPTSVLINKCEKDSNTKKCFLEAEGIIINYGIIKNIPPIYEISSNFKGSGYLSGFDTHSGIIPTGVFNQDLKNPYFGSISLPKLCNRIGPNAFNNTGASFSCEPALYNNGDSDLKFTVQSQLNGALTKAFLSCIRDSKLDAIYDYTYTGDGSTEITFLDEGNQISFNITLQYSENGKEKTYVPKYSYPQRIKKLYTLGYMLAQKEISDIDFKTQESIKNYPDYYDNKFGISLYDNYIVGAPDSQYDDLLIIEDKASQINFPFDSNSNSPSDPGAVSPTLHFAYAIENRRPYMEYIPDLPENPTITGYDYAEDYGLGISKSAAERTFSFVFKVLDPDDNDETGIYGGSLGSKQISQTGAKYLEFISSTSSSFVDTSKSWGSIALPNAATPITITKVLSCKNQCVLNPYGLKPFSPTIYSFKAQVSDGQYSDYQTFSITVNP